MVTAGFPCQDLSQVGQTRGISGSQSGLINEVLRLLSTAARDTKWLVLENVPFMLRLHKGHAMHEITAALDAMGWSWAYRILDSHAFGLPQRRRRLFLLASRTEDPRPALLGEDAGEPPPRSRGRHACGFYWTEGHRGLGWAVDALPPLKGGSGLAIPSPPAIWFPGRHAIACPSIEDAERLQGFAPHWTKAACEEASGDRARWRLVGNAVSIPVAEWLADRLRTSDVYDAADDFRVLSDQPWPEAGYRVAGEIHGANVSSWPISVPAPHLASFIEHRLHPLSLRAAAGFLARLEHSCLKRDEAFVSDLRMHVAVQRTKAAADHMRKASTKAKSVRKRSKAKRSMPKAPVDPAVSRRMAATRGRDNPAELALRSALHRQGFRFRVHLKLLKGLQRTADIAFPSSKLAVFLDGCFWHGCPIHATWPKTNATAWRQKIEENRRRDRDTDKKLKAEGWSVIRIWEHEDSDVVQKRLAHTLRVRLRRR